MKYLHLFLFFAVIFFFGCQEDIKLEIDGGAEKVVIEGSIENGGFAEVIITRNSPLFSAMDLSNILISDAKVYVSNGIITDTLKFDTLLTTSNPFLYTGSKIIGQVGQKYFLTVVVDNKTYTSETTIPNPVPLDSVWFQVQPPEDTLGFAWAHFSEPAGIGNHYRWFAKIPTQVKIINGNPVILNRRYVAPMGSIFDDKFIDGKSFDFAYSKALDPTESAFDVPEDDAYDEYFKDTDTIYIKFCSIDKNTAKFYETYENALQSNGNPFASPAIIVSNINGGALGVWAGYGATLDTIMPK